MSRKKNLSRKQLAVIDDLFAGELDEHAVLTKHKVTEPLYNKWLAEERFSEALSRRISRAHRQSQLIVARYAPLAAAKLVQLTESDSQETARKACLDIISGPFPAPQFTAGSDSGPASAEHPAELSPETASRLLATLAEEQRKAGPSSESEVLP